MEGCCLYWNDSLCHHSCKPDLQEIEHKQIAPELYPYGSRGPVGAHYLAAKYDVRWGDMSADEERDS